MVSRRDRGALDMLFLTTGHPTRGEALFVNAAHACCNQTDLQSMDHRPIGRHTENAIRKSIIARVIGWRDGGTTVWLMTLRCQRRRQPDFLGEGCLWRRGRRARKWW
jgi:hypothetical protein